MNTNLSSQFVKELEEKLNKKLNTLNVLLPNQSLSLTMKHSEDGNQTEAVFKVLENGVEKNIDEVFSNGSALKDTIAFLIHTTFYEMSNKKYGSWAEAVKSLEKGDGNLLTT